MKIVSVVGARPQFVKLGMMVRAFGRAAQAPADLEHVIVHTGQHYDRSLSDVFFDELELPAPDGTGPGLRGLQTRYDPRNGPGCPDALVEHDEVASGQDGKLGPRALVVGNREVAQPNENGGRPVRQ